MIGFSKSLRSASPARIKPLLRTASTLVIAEHDNTSLSPSSLSAVTAAGKLKGDITLLILGHEAQDVAKQVMSCLRRPQNACSSFLVSKFNRQTTDFFFACSRRKPPESMYEYDEMLSPLSFCRDDKFFGVTPLENTWIAGYAYTRNYLSGYNDLTHVRA